MATKKKRWVCPICNVGKLGGQRPAKDNIIRYCLPCSEKTGKLVLRICPADETKKRKKAEALAAKKAKNALKPKKPRTTKRSWMRNARYEYTIKGLSDEDITVNMMRIAERMCQAKGWQRPYTMNHCWNNTMNAKGTSNHPRYERTWSGGVRIQRSRTSYRSTGRAGEGYGATITMGKAFHDALETLLHELCHIDQDNSTISVVNGVRRPHDLAFNQQMLHMAKLFWGYPYTPIQAGFTVGNGYAPSRHLSDWLEKKINEKDEKVIKWISAK